MFNLSENAKYGIIIGIAVFLALVIIWLAFAYAVPGAERFAVPGALVSVALALFIPIWTTYVINIPDLRVEIISIERKIPEDVIIDIAENPELSALLQLSTEPLNNFFPVKTIKTEYNINDLEKLLDNARLKSGDIPNLISRRRKELNEIKTKFNNKTISVADLDLLLRPLSISMHIDEHNLAESFSEVEKAYARRIELISSVFDDIVSNLPAAASRINEIKTKFESECAFFVIHLSIINQGRLGTAIKAPALLRVFVGENRYFDLELEIKDSEAKSDIQASGSKVMLFCSARIADMTAEGKEMIYRYWNRANAALVLVEDIYGTKHASPKHVFAAGLYRREVYQGLSNFASSRRHST
jgi:hypothetical protein